jgi:hypothetical protein
LPNARAGSARPATVATGRAKALSVRDFLVFDDLSLVETAEAGSFDCRDVDKHIFAATLWLNEPIPFLRVEPLHGTFRHICSNWISYSTTY